MNWARAYGAPECRGRIKVQPEDFQVDEQLSFEPSGTGDHVFLRIRKTGLNTDEVSKILARHGGVVRSAVGYAGMKDRHAVTSQWFSVPSMDPITWDTGVLADGRVEVLEVTRHPKKLKKGALKGNRFQIIVRDVEGSTQTLADRAEKIRQTGFPNYFGPQRFGDRGQNLDRALAFFNQSYRPRGRHQRGLMFSTARSWLFNHVLQQRVSDGTWNQPLAGDVMVLSGTHQYFVPTEIGPDLLERIAHHDISPSGPMAGVGEVPVSLEADTIESQVYVQHHDFYHGLINAQVKHARRPLVVWPQDMTTDMLDANTLKLEFALPSGSYATSLIRELLLQPCQDATWI